MRPAKEIADRLRQEYENLKLWAMPPKLPASCVSPFPLPILPLPETVASQLAGTPFPDELRKIGEGILQHKFPLLGLEIEAGPEILWRRDYLNRKETGTSYFRGIPYLDPSKAGDHKIIWELNRHQHLVLLAQISLFDPDDKWIDEILRQIESWIDANPFQCGINWASALEVGVRALSWTWIYHLMGARMPAGTRGRFLESLYQHGRHLEINLSFYFSPNTHLLGEAVALHALGTLFPYWPEAGQWATLGAAVAKEQMNRQVLEDGAHFERSTYYHVYALDMFLFHSILSEPNKAYRAKLARMADYLEAIIGPARSLPFIGDDDGGRFFHPYGDRHLFGRATLAACGRKSDPEDLWPMGAWWLGPVEREQEESGSGSRLFPAVGVAVMSADDRHVIVDAGNFGPWGSGHSHSDTLSIVARQGDREILIDPGTYTYVGDAAQRDWFRGSSAHNTIRIDGLDQATPVNPFRWSNQPMVTVREWTTSDTEDFLDAECVSRGLTHRRRILFAKPDFLFVVDEVRGAGEHDVEQFWHTDDRERIVVGSPVEAIETWRSPVFGVKVPAQALRVHRRGAHPMVFAAAVLLGDIVPVEIVRSEDSVLFRNTREFSFSLKEPSHS
jgi:hypothetical protein